MDLLSCRKELDRIDRNILELFEERMDICKEVAKDKIKTGKAVLDVKREEEKLQKIEDLTQNPDYKMATKEIFAQMMTVSRRMQYQIMNIKEDSILDCVEEIQKEGAKVVYQGVEGAYSHGATLKFFGEDANTYHVATFEDAMNQVEIGNADYAVIPIENSTAGSVIDNYDNLVQYHNYIVAEIYMPITHNLLVTKEANLEDISTVYSHQQALMQCSTYLGNHKEWKTIGIENTAVSAKKVAEDNDITQACIASDIAAKRYRLKTLKKEIQNEKGNTTRFIVLSNKKMYQKDATKLSISFELPHQCGSLYNVLGNFIFNGVNMMKIESRPIATQKWHYRFFVDIEGNLSDSSIINSLVGIEKETINMRILGNY